MGSLIGFLWFGWVGLVSFGWVGLVWVGLDCLVLVGCSSTVASRKVVPSGREAARQTLATRQTARELERQRQGHDCVHEGVSGPDDVREWEGASEEQQVDGDDGTRGWRVVFVERVKRAG